MDFTKNDLSAAIDKLTYLKQATPKDAAVLQLLAKTNFAQKDYNAAAKASYELLKLSPNDSVAQEVLHKIASIKP